MQIKQDEKDVGLIDSRWLWIPLTVTFAAGIIEATALPFNADAAWYLYMAGRILDGAKPYRDIFDTNPPLIVLVNIAAVAFARWLHQSPLVVFPTILFAAIAASLAMMWRTSRGCSLALRQAAVITWAYFLLVSAGAVFGQREHIFLILIFPYAFSAVGELAGRRPSMPLAIGSGLMAGVGFAIKPFFVLPLIVTELLLVYRRGWKVWLRPESLAIGLIFFAYAAVLILWTPEYFDIARRYAPLYPHYQPGGAMLLETSWHLPAIVGVIALAWFSVRKAEPGWVQVFGAIGLGVTGSVYLTGKGWPYHWFPTVALTMTLLIGAMGIVLSREQSHVGRFGGIAAMFVIMPAFAAMASWIARAEIWEEIETVRIVQKNTNPGDAVLVLTPWVHTSFPMINVTGVRWGMRHPMLWQIPAFYSREAWSMAHYHALDMMSPMERRFVDEIAKDFEAARPALILVDSDPPVPSLAGFDYLKYFETDPRFATEMANYEPFGKIKTFRIYRRRQPLSAPTDRPVLSAGRSKSGR